MQPPKTVVNMSVMQLCDLCAAVSGVVQRSVYADVRERA